MPRSGWIAIGAAIGALAMPALAAAPPELAPILVGIAGLVAIVGPALALRPARRAALAAVLLGMAAIGIRMLVGQIAAPSAGALRLPDGGGPWAAIVDAVGSPRAGQQSATLVIGPGRSGTRLAATLPAYPEVRPGQAIRVSGTIEPPPADDYGTYLRRIGVAGTLRARSLERVPGADRIDPLSSLRSAAADALTHALPEPEAGLAAGILVGTRERVDRQLAQDFTAAGVSHVVAISGWNIALVAAAIGALAGRTRRRRRTILVLVAVLAYVLVAGASSSVVRAGAMAAVVLLARESGRAGAAATGLGWAAALLLLADPSSVLDPGFGLSTLATAGLLAWGDRTAAWLGRRFGGRLPGWLCESLGVSIAAQVATLPLVLLAFGRLALVAPAVNLMVVPLVVPAMAGGGIALLAGGLVPLGLPSAVAALVALPGWLALHIMIGLVRIGAGLPGAGVQLEPTLGVALATVVVLGLAIASSAIARRALGQLGRELTGLGRRTNRRSAEPGSPVGGPAARAAGHRSGTRPTVGRAERILAGLLAVSVASVLVAASARPDGRVRITVLDVGQGDAVLVEGDAGSRMLVDGGPDPARLLAALDGRLPPWDRRLDLLVLTHPHEDHVAGLPRLLERYRVGAIVEPGMHGPGPGYGAFAAALAISGRTSSRLSTGARFRLDDIGFRVLWPDADRVPPEPTDTGTGINNVSIVLLGTFGSERFLLAGDIEQDIDPILLSRVVPTVEVLKVAHHGSRTASTPGFLDAVRPKVAIVSAGAGNLYGHPAPATIARLADRGAAVWRTDRNGPVTVTLDGRHASATAERGTPTVRGSAAVGDPAVGSDPAIQAAVAPIGAGAGVGASGRDPLAAAFSCGIARPGPGPVPSARPTAPPSTALTVAAWRPARVTAPEPTTGPTAARSSLGYHPGDDRTRADRGRRDPAPAHAASAPGATFAGRRRGRGLAGGPRGRVRRYPRSATRRDGRTPARHRQGPAVDAARPPPRPGLGSLARRAWSPRARAGGGGPSGHAARRRGVVRGLAGDLTARGADRGLCGQACRPATRADGRPVRRLGSALPPAQQTRDRATRDPSPRRSSRTRRLRRGRLPTDRCQAVALDGRRDAGRDDGHRRGDRRVRGCPSRRSRARRTMTAHGAVLGYYFGDDGYGLERAVDKAAARLAADSGTPPARVRQAGATTSAARIAEQVATATLFGGGALVSVVDPAPLLRSKADRDALSLAIRSVAPGNGLVFLEPIDGSERRLASLESLRAQVAEAGGETLELKAPKEGRMAAWVEDRARELGVRLGAGAAQELARRIGAFVREGDVDRRRMGDLAVGELRKLALYRPDAVVERDDVRVLVAEAVPASTWAFLDAVANRHARTAADLLDQLLETTPEPVVVVQLHRRLRQLIEVADRLDAGMSLPAVARELKLKEFPARKLADAARAWSVDELIGALDGLLALDAVVKGVAPASERQRRLAFQVWIEDRVAVG